MVNVDKNINQHNAGWSFENISDNFDEHIKKSIPLYDQGGFVAQIGPSAAEAQHG